ncbi:MAG: diguanylate cyclase [Pseudomonadota bacterium]
MKHVDEKSIRASAQKKAPKSSGRVNRYQTYLDGLEPELLIWGPDGACEYFSAGAHELLNISEKELFLGVTLKDFVQRAVAAREYSAADAQRVFAAQKTSEPYIFVRMTKGKKRIRTFGQPMPDGRIVVTFTDITEQKREEATAAALKARAEESEKQLKKELERATAAKTRLERNQSELERLSLVAAHAKDLILISDATNRIEWANEAFRRHNGLDLEMDLIGKSARDVLVGEETNLDGLSEIDEAIRNRRAITIELFCHRRTGAPYWMEQEITPVFNAKGEHTNFIMVGRDVTERKSAAIAAREAQRFEDHKRGESRLLAEFNEWLQSSDSLEELFQVVSSFLEKLLPGSAGAVYVYADARDVLEAVCSWPGEPSFSHFAPQDCWGLRRGRSYYFGANAVDFACTHVTHECGEDHPEHYFCLPIIAHGDTVGLLHIRLSEETAEQGQEVQKLANFCAEQISLAIANVKLREQLREQSTRDPLTALYNRRFFLDYAKREIGRCAASNKAAALVSLDIDHFKKFNDTYGHDAGDLVLKSVAEVLQTLFRDSDVPCRLGGEEFIVMLPGASLERALERAEELRSEIEAGEVRYGGQHLKVTASLGVAVYTKHGKTLEALMQTADDALYAAKDGGRNCVKTID